MIPSVRPQSFYFSHLQHKGTATTASPQRAPPKKISQTNFRQESFVSLDRSNELVMPTQGLGTDCEAAAIGRFIPSLGHSEASIFAMSE